MILRKAQRVSQASCTHSQDSLESAPSLEAARMAVLGPSYSSGTLRPSSANIGEPCLLQPRHHPPLPVDVCAYASQPSRLRYTHLMDCLGPLLHPAMQPASTGAALANLYFFR